MWDPEAVAAILGTRPVFEDDSSYRFTFETRGQAAVLLVFPYGDDVELSIGELGRPWVSWRLNCSSIAYHEESPDEGGPCLIFNPAGNDCTVAAPSHWIVLGRSEDGVEILTVFRHRDG